jgi:hypothetical protein
VTNQYTGYTYCVVWFKKTELGKLHPVCRVFKKLESTEKCAKEQNGKIYLRMELHGVFE